MSAARANPDLLARITEWVGDGALALAYLGHEGEPDIFRIPFKKPADTTLTVDQQAYNTVHGALRCLGERANSLIKTTYKLYAAIAAAPGAWSTSSGQRLSCSATRTTEPHDQHQLIAQRHARLLGKAHPHRISYQSTKPMTSMSSNMSASRRWH